MSNEDFLEMAPDLAVRLRRELLRLAHHEDELAADEAAKVPYWAPHPSSISGHRAAAKVLRADADQLVYDLPRLGPLDNPAA